MQTKAPILIFTLFLPQTLFNIIKGQGLLIGLTNGKIKYKSLVFSYNCINIYEGFERIREHKWKEQVTKSIHIHKSPMPSNKMNKFY